MKNKSFNLYLCTIPDYSYNTALMKGKALSHSQKIYTLKGDMFQIDLILLLKILQVTGTINNKRIPYQFPRKMLITHIVCICEIIRVPITTPN